MKLKITRTELKEIFDVACKTWQPRIEKYAQRNPFGDTIDFSEKEINEMLKACTAEQLPLVKRIFNVVDSFEKIKSVDDACAYLGEVDDDVRQLRLLQNVPNLERKIIAGQELIVIGKALNNKEVLDWDDSNVSKYIPWWYLGKNFRLDIVYCNYVSSCSCARLYYTSRELAQYSADTFKEIWKDYIN